MLNATVAVRRLRSRVRGDGSGPPSRAESPRRPGLGAARRADVALRSASRRLSALVSGTLAARQARTPAALIRRLESPERLVAVLVAGFLLVASVTAVPGLAGGGTGATEGAGLAPRLALGGDSGLAGDAGPFSPFDGVGADPGLGLDETATGMTLGQESTEGSPEVVGQFLDDGTLLKPVVVDATVEDGRSKLRSYRVRSGDTLTGIASQTGVSMMTIWWANRLTSKDDLKIGQVLVIPPVDGLVVTVEAGDTLASIAAEERVSPADIVEANALTDETLVLGQVLIIPGARGDPIPTPKPTRQPVVQVATVSRQPGSRTTTRPPAQYAGGALAWPVAGGFISQYFHFGHPALDIAADHGTSIRAAAPGTVIFAGWKSNGGGFQVWIAHGSDLYTTYSHMSTVAVSSGEGVGRGTFIGRVGSTGWSTGPHLHLEVWRGYPWGGGHRVNPLGFL